MLGFLVKCLENKSQTGIRGLLDSMHQQKFKMDQELNVYNDATQGRKKGKNGGKEVVLFLML